MSHLEDSVPYPEDSVPNLEDSVPYLEDSVSHLEDSAPYLEDSVPHLEDYVPHLEDSVLHLEDYDPYLEDSVLHLEDYVPYLEDSVPHLEDYIPHLEESAPQSSTEWLQDDRNQINNDFTGERTYLAACEYKGVTPVTYFIRHIEDTEVVLRFRGLGPMGAQALSVPLKVRTPICICGLL